MGQPIADFYLFSFFLAFSISSSFFCFFLIFTTFHVFPPILCRSLLSLFLFPCLFPFFFFFMTPSFSHSTYFSLSIFSVSLFSSHEIVSNCGLQRVNHNINMTEYAEVEEVVSDLRNLAAV